MSYPSTRSGLDRLEAAKLDQEIRREKIRLGEPLHDDIRLTPVAKFKKIFTSKKSKIKNQKPVRVPEIDQPIPYEPIAAKPVKKVSKLIAFFSTKRSVDENKQPETFRAKSRIDRHFAELQNPTSVSTAKKIIRPKNLQKFTSPIHICLLLLDQILIVYLCSHGQSRTQMFKLHKLLWIQGML